MSAPNFFMVGAMKSGTTSLYHILGEHPDIYFPSYKEPHYFVSPGEKLMFNGKDDMMIANKIFLHKSDEYFELFNNKEKYKIRGDASAMYLYYPQASKNISEFDSSAKILVVLRNPVDRAYSSYLHLRRDDRESFSFEEALKEEKARIDNKFNPLWHYRRVGLYADQVQRYLDNFEKVKVVIYEDFKSNPEKILSEICDFLSIEEFQFDLAKRFNVSGVPKSRFVHNALRKPNKIKSLFKGMIPESIKTKVKNHLVNLNLEKASPIDPITRRSLLEFYESDISKLENILKLDLNIWRS
ncbi:sulfotransferase family protein [Ekhidna sp.]